jgi:hypothetical protein
MKDKDITAYEINTITEKCPPREQAFFTIMRQSGLPPRTIKQLKVGNVERILEPNPPIPCKINVPHEKSRTFIGGEAVKYLKLYLRKNRTNLTPESLLFTIRNNPNKEINTKDVSRAFRLAAQKLERANKITYEVRRGKPSELRLYSLVGFYKKNAKDYLSKLNNSSTPKDDELCRKLYEENAITPLEIEPPATKDIHQLRKQQRELENQNIELTKRLTKIEESMMPVTRLYHELLGTIPKNVLSELKPHIPTKNEEDREQRLQKALHKLRELEEKEQKKQKNNNPKPRRSEKPR